MGRLRMTVGRLLRARFLVGVGAAGFTAGVLAEFGPGWWFMSAGAAAAAYGLLLVDVDDDREAT